MVENLPSVKSENLIMGHGKFMSSNTILRWQALTFGRCSLPFAVNHLSTVCLPFAVYQMPGVITCGVVR